MQVETQAGQTPAGKAIGKTRLLLDSIKFEHTIFALPFAYLRHGAGGARNARLARSGIS